MDLRILGPLEVVDDDRKVALGGPRPRALLAILLLHRGSIVPAEQLIDHLYGGRPPRRAAKSLQAHVSRLRKALAGGCNLRTAAGGYALDVEPGSFDLDRFDDLVERGRDALGQDDPEGASSALREALALWRGPPLTDFRYDEFAQTEIARLEERRLAVVEDRIDADLALGRHTDLVAELEVMVAEFPLRERLRSQLMLALYRCGRQTEALELYAGTRRLLSEELGLEPSDELKKLQRAILEHDPSLAPPSRADMLRSKTPSAQAVTAFVGRTAELDELRAVMEDAFLGRGRLVLISGEPGIGKSRLADELIGYARSRGAQVLVGRSWEAGGAPAYWPWVQSLRVYIRECDPNVLREQLGAEAPDLAHLIPELLEIFPDLPSPPSPEAGGARFRLFDAATAFLKRAAEARALVLVLDDLHAADEPSLLLLQFLTRELDRSRLLVIGAYRDVDPSLRDPLVATLSELMREPVTHRISIDGLVEADVGEYISIAAGVQPEAATIAEIHAETDGNPLFVGELVRLLASEGRLEGTDGPLGIPSGVREVIGSRVGRLSEPCQRILTLAAVLGREFALDALERLCALPQDELLDVLDEAMTERVVGQVPGASGRLRFGHALIRDTLYDDLTPARRLQLHRRAAEALEAVYAADLEPHLSELALHYFAAAPAGTADAATEYARRAGHRAASQLAYEEAVRLYEMALSLARHDLACCDLLIALGDVQARAGDTAASKHTFRQAADLAKGLGASEQLARAALGYGGRIIWEVSRDDEYLVPLLEAALSVLGGQDSALRVRLLTRLGGGPLRDSSFPPERRKALTREALETARQLADESTLAYALAGYIPAHQSPEFTREQVEPATELIQIAMEVGDLERAVEGHDYRAGALIELGDVQAAKADVGAMAKLAERLHQPAQGWYVAEFRAHLGLLEGRIVEAEDLIADALALGERAQAWNAAVSYRLQLFVLRRLQGRLEEIEGLVRHSADDYPTYPIFQCVLAHTMAALGNEIESRQAFEALVADGLIRLPLDEEWLVSMGFLAETTRVVTDARRAAVLYEQLLPYADRVATGAPEISTGSVSRYLGILATTMSRWDNGARHFEDAIALNERIGARPWLALTQEDYAQMLLERDAPGDREKAQELLAQAVDAYRELGMETHAARASAAVP